MNSIEKRRFDALAGYSRGPAIVALVQEYDWLATDDERVLGVLTWDRHDHDFGWVAFGRDELLRYRAIDVGASLPTSETARAALVSAMTLLSQQPDSEFYQGDTTGNPVDFFKSHAPESRLHPNYRALTETDRFSPARELIGHMMRYHEDIDGNFVEQFQTTGFDARLWELYLYATFVELGYARVAEFHAPDFCLSGLDGQLSIEATTCNPPDGGLATLPEGKDAYLTYLENYIPIKIGRALRQKLIRKYWELPHMKDVPLVFAVQDFHRPGVMRAVTYAATEYVYGFRYSLRDGTMHRERINEHRYNTAVEPSGFFDFPDAENVSAVIVNPQGTLTKFNRMGFIAGFGKRDIKMIRRGVRRGERDEDGQPMKSFVHEVHKEGYEESWVEGMTVLHNPRARIPIDPMMIAGAAHEFLKPNGRLMSMIPNFQPLFSETFIISAKGDDEGPPLDNRESA